MGATWIALALLMQWASCLRSASTLSDGASLLAAKDAWKANLPSWTGDDPCQNWEGVKCNRNQRVIFLNLSDKGVAGPIPQEIANLQYLENLDLSNQRSTSNARNEITGGVSVLGGLTNLRSLNLTFNKITLDQFPKEIYNFANLTDLRIDNNQLSGPLPQDISKLTKLQYLSLACNFFSGQPPTVPQAMIFNDDGNCFANSDRNQKIKCYQQYYDCQAFSQIAANGGCPECPNKQVLEDKTSCVCTMPFKKGGKSKLIGGIVGGVLFFIVTAILLLWRCIKPIYSTSRYLRDQELSTSFEVPGVQQFTLQEIKRATAEFNTNNVIGVGGFGRVFYGVTDDGRKVAIKCAESVIQSSLVFRNEVILLSRLHHRNLVHLVGFCEDHGVQKFMLTSHKAL